LFARTARFFLGIALEPPRAGTTPKIVGVLCSLGVNGPRSECNKFVPRRLAQKIQQLIIN
jgi:hypothetical protein